jgi:hypothetical protein
MSNLQNNQRTKELKGHALVIVGVLVGLTGNGYVAWIWSWLFELKRGISIRPINAVALTGDIAVLTALLGLAFSITGIIMSRGWWRWLGVVAIGLCLMPVPVMHILLNWSGVYLSE